MCFQNPGHTSSEYFTISLLEKSAAWENSSKHWSNFVLISEFPELKTSQKNLAYSNDSGDFQKVTHCSLETKVKKIPENLTLCCWCCYCAGSFWIIWGATMGKAWKAGWGCTLEAAGLSAKAEFVDVIGVQVNVDEEQHSGQLIHKGTLACNAAQQLH